MASFADRNDEVRRLSQESPVSWLGAVLLVGLSMLAAALAVTVVLADAKPASAHLQGAAPSRASDGNIVAACNSNNYCYTYRWSQPVWNEQPGKPDIVGDTSSNPPVSLGIGEDYYDSTVETVAYWSAGHTPDAIFNNNYYMKGASTRYHHVVSTHELGHSVGFGHASYMGEGDTTDWCRISVMYPYVVGAIKCGDQYGYLRSHDKFDWNLYWES